jgi:excisionase family DNA binding protein
MTQSDESVVKDELLTVTEVQQITQFGMTHIYKALRSGALVSHQAAAYSHYRIRRSEVDAWLDRMRKSAPREQKAS